LIKLLRHALEQGSVKHYSPSEFFWRILRFLLWWILTSYDEWLLSRVRSPYVVQKTIGGLICLDTEDRGIAADLYTNRMREPFIYSVFKEIINPGDIVIDIGANIGYYAMLEARKVGEQGIVYAIEPVIHNYNLLKQSKELNGYDNIKLYRAAIGNINGTACMKTGIRPNHCHIARQGNEKVNICTLDEFAKNIRPDIVRMDVEGYCHEILQGAQRTFSHRLKLIIELHCEALHNAGKLVATVNLLRAYGFRVIYAAVEPYAACIRHGFKVASFLSARVAACFGPHEITLDDILRDDKWHKIGAVELLLIK